MPRSDSRPSLRLYADLFARPGTRAFTLPNAVARLPMGMFSVAVVLMITAHHDSYALAGSVVATALTASVVGAPLVARLIDRRGQTRVAVPATAVAVTGYLALLLCVLLGAPTWSYFGCVLLTGATPNIGGMSRARWAFLLPEPDSAERQAANAFEQTLDELCFVCGPVLAAVLCSNVFPESGTLTAAALLLGGVLAFAAQRATEPPPAPPPAAAAASALSWFPWIPGMGFLLVAFACTGTALGSMEVVTLAFADEQGQRAWGGAVLALHATGSGVAGLVFGLLRLGGSLGARFAGCAVAMAVLMTLPLLASRTGGTLAWLAPAMLVSGMATAPTLVSGMTLAQHLTPSGRLNEGMTLTVTALLAGISLGTATGGWAADHAGGTVAAAYLIPVVAAGLAAGVAVWGGARRR